MRNKTLPSPTLQISKRDARRFLLAHQNLWPPRNLKGKAGILNLIYHLGCIQYDTINVVGRNADLALQSRIGNYRPNLLDELLYTDRILWDGWDKMASIYASGDWPYFRRRRKVNGDYYKNRSEVIAKYAPEIIRAIQERGPLSSIDIKNRKKIAWTWGDETGVARAAMEMLYAAGKLGIHHKIGTRRIFDLTSNLLDKNLIEAKEVNRTEESYRDWHVLRRIGSLGLAHPGAGEHWLGIVGIKSDDRKAALRRLVEQGQVVAVEVDGLEDDTFFMRAIDMPTMEKVRRGRQPKAQAAIIAPLDNLIWDRKTIKRLFGFEYIWEVYKPKPQRKWGYYVLPVVYGDQFVARLNPKFDKKTRELVIDNWWWQEGIKPDEAMEVALSKCLRDFGNYLDVKKIKLGKKIVRKKSLHWVRDLSEEK